MRDPVYPVFCALGAVLTVLPLPWHWKARNAGTLIYVGWAFSACIVFLVNSLVWAGNTNDTAPIWCDISSRFVIALSIGLPASSLCVQRRLYRIAAMKDISTLGYTMKKKQLIIDLMIGIGFPFVVIALHYVVQPARYMIIEDIGCWPTETNMILSMFMVRIWSAVVALASFVYACLTIRLFFKTRRQFSRVLSESGADLNLSRFFRLMALAATDMSFSLPLSLYFFIVNLMFYPIRPWISWTETHKHINEVWVTSYEEQLLVPGLKTSFDLNRWSIPGCAFLFFMFFGLSSEAIEQYRDVFWRVANLFGIKRPEPTPKSPTTSWTRRMMSSTKHTDTTFVRTEHTTSMASISNPSNSSSGRIDKPNERASSSPYVKDLESQN
ncbi:STE3-type pheromone receptor [Ceratobasidium sp. AG-Ba]|nr:STE3-type pheromone receptor [Ceratobasidium sp. AG-Ba]